MVHSAQRRQHQNRCVHPEGPQRQADVAPVRIRQSDIENHHVGSRIQLPEKLGGGRRGDNRMPIGGQGPPQQTTQRAVVFAYRDPSHTETVWNLR
ncbi:hypothetical protein GCM10009554_43570 [Kribbella koreensis]|uniref:Uncharacterized protein n=1 Tax=Kribbella koreensis TaxID=57909 RepID=A0ABP4B788_9ACTN